ncbi:hypothetical protein B0H19DRAFT_1081319 [Mycena capillaripes]|nr:hypothetical protein B0H19DRAFT_1081238 [Mycena capillaripes]KAJ6533148.1 hypothetical protein B0H19DRAFT_1081319 [Mycena capillaripes]
MSGKRKSARGENENEERPGRRGGGGDEWEGKEIDDVNRREGIWKRRRIEKGRRTYGRDMVPASSHRIVHAPPGGTDPRDPRPHRGRPHRGRPEHLPSANASRASHVVSACSYTSKVEPRGEYQDHIDGCCASRSQWRRIRAGLGGAGGRGDALLVLVLAVAGVPVEAQLTTEAATVVLQVLLVDVKPTQTKEGDSASAYVE